MRVMIFVNINRRPIPEGKRPGRLSRSLTGNLQAVDKRRETLILGPRAQALEGVKNRSNRQGNHPELRPVALSARISCAPAGRRNGAQGKRSDALGASCGSHQIKAPLSSFIRAFRSRDQPELKGRRVIHAVTATFSPHACRPPQGGWVWGAPVPTALPQAFTGCRVAAGKQRHPKMRRANAPFRITPPSLCPKGATGDSLGQAKRRPGCDAHTEEPCRGDRSRPRSLPHYRLAPPPLL